MTQSTNLYSPEVQECPYNAYKTLRDESPVHVMPETGAYLLTRYADIMAVLQRPDVFHHGPAPASVSSDDGTGGDVASSTHQNPAGQPLTVYVDGDEVHQSPLNSDPPVHRCYRNLIDGHFSMRGVQRHVELVEGHATAAIDRWIDRGEVDLIKEFSEPFPRNVITDIFGFDMADTDRLQEWSAAWVLPFSGAITEEQQNYCTQMMQDFRAYIGNIVREKEETPDETVVSSLVHSTFVGPDGISRPLKHMEIVSMIDMIFTGGHHTTTNAFGSMMEMILKRPDLQKALRENKEMRAGVIEEALRLESVVQGMFRHTMEPFEVGGVLIPAGSTVHLRFAAANRDERVFVEPDKLDPERSNVRRHLAFGIGEHHCPGSALARLEMSVALDAMLERTTDMWLLPSEEAGLHTPGLVLRGLRELKVGFTPA
ncbi:cytochrome P450 [Streptomyces sp. NPDC002758]